MPDQTKFPKIPAFKKDLIALWKGYGPRWMFAVLIVLSIPLILLAGGFFLNGVAAVMLAMK